MRQTIAQTIIDEMSSKGYTLRGKTRGLFSYRNGSNLARELERLGLTKDSVEVRAGARAGQNRNDGYELLIFGKVEKTHRGKKPPTNLTQQMGVTTAKINLKDNPEIKFVQTKAPKFKPYIPKHVRRSIGM